MAEQYKAEEIAATFREIHSYLRKLSRHTVEGVDLSGPRFAILMIISHHEQLRVSDLQEKLQVAMSTVTQMADALASSGYLERSRSRDDRRVVLLRLTKKGEELVATLKCKHLEHLGAALSCFTKKQREDLLEHLEKLSLSLKEHAARVEEAVDG